MKTLNSHAQRRFAGSVALLALLLFVPQMMKANTAARLVKQINAFTGGGKGSLTAIGNGNIVTVTGSLSDAKTLSLNIDADVTVKWEAKFTSTDNTKNLITLSGSGTFDVTGGMIKATNYNAISTGNSNVTIAVNGGSVWSIGKGRAIYAGGKKSSITVNSGFVYSTTGEAITASGPGSEITVSNGMVFAYGRAITGKGNVIFLPNNSDGFTGVTGTGIVVAWNRAAGHTVYTQGSSDDISKSPASATATWYSIKGIPGILLSNNYFIPIEGVTVNATAPPPAAVCSIGYTYFTSLDDALAAVKTGETIQLLTNIDYDKQITIDGKSVTFYMNEFNLNVLTTDKYGLYVTGGGEVKLLGSGEFNVAGNTCGVTADGGIAFVTNVTGTTSISGVAFGAMALRKGDKVVVRNNIKIGIGIIIGAQNGAGVYVYGNATGNYVGIWAMSGSEVYVGGDMTSTYGSTARDTGSRITVHGNVTTDSVGVYAYNGGAITIGGDLTVKESYCAFAENEGSNIYVVGNVISTDKSTENSSAVQTKDKAFIVLGKNVIGNHLGISAESGSTVNAAGDVTAKYGVLAMENSAITVNGSVMTEGVGVSASGKSRITVNGDVSAKKDRGAFAQGYSSVTVAGNVVSTDSVGIGVASGAILTVGKNVTAGDIGVYANYGIASIGGSVSAKSPGKTGIRIDSDNSNVTVDGKISISPTGAYISFNGLNKAQSDYNPASTKPGYLEYSDKSNFVWVKQ